MANIKSQKKRALTNAKKNLQNTSERSRLKTGIKKVLKAVEANDKAAAESALTAATSELMKAQTKGVYHKNNVSRKVSRLSQAVNKMN